MPSATIAQLFLNVLVIAEKACPVNLRHQIRQPVIQRLAVINVWSALPVSAVTQFRLHSLGHGRVGPSTPPLSDRPVISLRRRSEILLVVEAWAMRSSDAKFGFITLGLHSAHVDLRDAHARNRG